MIFQIKMLLSTDSICSIFFMILLLKNNVILINSTRCSRIPDGVASPQTPSDGRFHVRILDNTDKYTPGKIYTSKLRVVHRASNIFNFGIVLFVLVKLEGIDSGQRTTPPTKHKFSGFILAVEKKADGEHPSSVVS